MRRYTGYKYLDLDSSHFEGVTITLERDKVLYPAAIIVRKIFE